MSSEFYSKYVIQNKIGDGTFSDVLKCQNCYTGQYFAVKKLKKHYNHVNEALDLPELFIMQKLPSHPNVLTSFEYMFEPQEGKLFMLFELMDMSLYELIQSRRRCLPENKVKQMFYQILKGVDHLHSHGIFHRDIKPENILVKKDSVKLADLGSIRGVHSQGPYTEYVSTRWYRAPECILSTGVYGPKMDVWACGCVYYEMLTSKPIFPGANELDQLTKIHQTIGTPKPRLMSKLQLNKSRLGHVKFTTYPTTNLTVLLPFTSDAGREILKRMLTYDPEVRTNVRRLLDHRYFNDLRETLPMKQWSSPSLDRTNHSEPVGKTTSKHRPTNYTKPLKTKLSTNTWGPSANTSRVGLVQSKKKITNSPPTLKKIPGEHTTQPNIKMNLTQKPAKIKPERITAKTMGDLPSLKSSFKRNMFAAAKEQFPGCSGLRAPKTFLPPITEQ